MRPVERDSPASGIKCQSEVLVMATLPDLNNLAESYLPTHGIFIRSEFVLAIKEVIRMAGTVKYDSPKVDKNHEVDKEENHMQTHDMDDAMAIDATTQINATLLSSFFQQQDAQHVSCRSGMIMIGHPGIGKLSFISAHVSHTLILLRQNFVANCSIRLAPSRGFAHHLAEPSSMFPSIHRRWRRPVRFRSW